MNSGKRIRRMQMQQKEAAITWGFVIILIVALLVIATCAAVCG